MESKRFTHKIGGNAGVGIANVEWVGLVVVVKVALARLPLTRHPLHQARNPRNWNTFGSRFFHRSLSSTAARRESEYRTKENWERRVQGPFKGPPKDLCDGLRFEAGSEKTNIRQFKGIFQPFELGGVTGLIRSAVKFWKAGVRHVTGMVRITWG